MTIDQILQLTHALVSIIELRAAPIPKGDTGLFRGIMAYALTMGALVLDRASDSSSETARDLKDHICQLAVSYQRHTAKMVTHVALSGTRPLPL